MTTLLLDSEDAADSSVEAPSVAEAVEEGVVDPEDSAGVVFEPVFSAPGPDVVLLDSAELDAVALVSVFVFVFEPAPLEVADAVELDAPPLVEAVAVALVSDDPVCELVPVAEAVVVAPSFMTLNASRSFEAVFFQATDDQPARGPEQSDEPYR